MEQSSAIRLRDFTIEGGEEGLAIKFALLRECSLDTASQAVRRTLASVLRGVRERDSRGELDAIMRLVRSPGQGGLRFLNDPVPYSELFLRGGLVDEELGDCDDFVVRAATYLGSAGYDCNFVVVSTDPRATATHIYLEVFYPSRTHDNRIAFDAAMPYGVGWEVPEREVVRRVRVPVWEPWDGTLVWERGRHPHAKLAGPDPGVRQPELGPAIEWVEAGGDEVRYGLIRPEEAVSGMGRYIQTRAENGVPVVVYDPGVPGGNLPAFVPSGEAHQYRMEHGVTAYFPSASTYRGSDELFRPDMEQCVIWNDGLGGIHADAMGAWPTIHLPSFQTIVGNVSAAYHHAVGQAQAAGKSVQQAVEHGAKVAFTTLKNAASSVQDAVKKATTLSPYEQILLYVATLPMPLSFFMAHKVMKAHKDEVIAQAPSWLRDKLVGAEAKIEALFASGSLGGLADEYYYVYGLGGLAGFTATWNAMSYSKRAVLVIGIILIAVLIILISWFTFGSLTLPALKAGAAAAAVMASVLSAAVVPVVAMFEEGTPAASLPKTAPAGWTPPTSETTQAMMKIANPGPTTGEKVGISTATVLAVAAALL